MWLLLCGAALALRPPCPQRPPARLLQDLGDPGPLPLPNLHPAEAATPAYSSQYLLSLLEDNSDAPVELATALPFNAPYDVVLGAPHTLVRGASGGSVTTIDVRPTHAFAARALHPSTHPPFYPKSAQMLPYTALVIPGSGSLAFVDLQLNVLTSAMFSVEGTGAARIVLANCTAVMPICSNAAGLNLVSQLKSLFQLVDVTKVRSAIASVSTPVRRSCRH